jgi:hypothetical protein
MYFVQPVTFHIQDAETKLPIEGAEIRTTYATMLDFGVLLADWGPRKGVTDTDGNLTLYIDPRKDCLIVDVNALNYQPEEHLVRNRIEKRLVSRGLFRWGSDIVLDMYKGPAARIDLVIPEKYQGPVIVQFISANVFPTTVGQRQFTFSVGNDGKIVIPDLGLVERVRDFENVSARYTNGATIPTIANWHEPKDPDRVALRLVTAVWKHHTWVFVVGTKTDADNMSEAIWGNGNDFNESAFKRITGLR